MWEKIRAQEWVYWLYDLLTHLSFNDEHAGAATGDNTV
jgi:hypothetical protein